VAIYDTADPGSTLYLATLDRESFHQMSAQQNLVIEQFGLLPQHII
jgi:hypothetical protein